MAPQGLTSLDASAMSQLFTPLKVREFTFKNRIFVAPMCQYSSEDGMPTDWHLVHLGSRAVGGAALVIMEATAVLPEGRISPADMGIWSDEHAEALSPIVKFIQSQGAAAGIQIAHAGRKASTDLPWLGGGSLPPDHGGWQVVAPSPIPFDPCCSQIPKELTESEIEETIFAFEEGAKRALKAGFDVLELHMAHGYLVHEFLSPLTNHRGDGWGGSFENRIRLALTIAERTRKVWPDNLPLFVRISATDWREGGWDLPQSIELSKRMRELGVDLIDCSSGALVPNAIIPNTPGYQVPFAEAIRREARILTGAVGLITEAEQANEIIDKGQADAVLIGREMLRDPYFPLRAARALGVKIDGPNQYARAL